MKKHFTPGRFLDNPKQAELILKNIRTKKCGPTPIDKVTKHWMTWRCFNEFHEAGDVSEEELVGNTWHGKAIEELEFRKC